MSSSVNAKHLLKASLHRRSRMVAAMGDAELLAKALGNSLRSSFGKALH